MTDTAAYIVNEKDNVATALSFIEKGREISLTGTVSRTSPLTAGEDIKRGFKTALSPIAKDELIIKYGIPIGRATADIAEGDCVHIHNMISLCDLRAASYNTENATPKDRSYSLEV